jgi:hypothetical protein
MAMGNDFLIDEMLKSFSEGFASKIYFSSFNQIISYADIEEVKLWRKNYPPFWFFLIKAFADF